LLINLSIIPAQLRGAIDDVLGGDNDWHTWYPWLASLQGTNGFVHLSANWVDKGWPQDPEPGFDYYILSGDSGMAGWDEHVANLYHRPVYMITLPEVYTAPTNELITHIPVIYYHRQISKLATLVDTSIQKNICYKASALTSRITQSKIIVFSALYQTLGHDGIYSLHDVFDPKNVHDWSSCHNDLLDEFTEYFRKNWLSKKIMIPRDDGDPLSLTNDAYYRSSLNFTQESFHYSLMYDAQSDREYIHSGPFLTEKTFKCLLSQTSFIPVGQFRSYRWLETMGMHFDYGLLDLTFDDDPGNISRLVKLTTLIKTLSQYPAQDLFGMTETSTRHNYAIIENGEFFERCEKTNQTSLSGLYERLLG
jgi:hypothetical protein